MEDINFSEVPLKIHVATTPLNSGGANFKTHVLVKQSSSKIVYKPSIGVVLFCFIFSAIGLGILFFSSYTYINTQNNSEDFPFWLLLIFGSVFTSVGSFMFYYNYKPRIFDKQLGMYYKAYKVNLHKTNTSKLNSQLPLKSILAIQIIGETIKSDNMSYNSFELNLVTNNNKRINVIDYGSIKSILDDAHVLSGFLNLPIWHAKSHQKLKLENS